VSSSGVLFALAVLQAQQGCDRREPAAEPTSAPAIVDAPAAESAPTAAPTVAPAAAPAAAPASAPVQPKPAERPAPAAKERPAREFFPATKSGGVHMLDRPAANAPAQQRHQQEGS
jgi:hypothetical protein